MKVIVAGGRDIPFNESSRGMMNDAVKASRFDISEIVSGACGLDADDPDREEKPCKGGDALGEAWGAFYGLPIRRFYAAWKRFGYRAGPTRNAHMAMYAEALIALPGGRGTAEMIRQARRYGLRVYVHAAKAAEG